MADKPVRKPISQKTRFEVFKRDNFTCQYCGASAPDVILEIDHIKPVSKGGTNSILNLVTSCRNCNRGKTNKVLSDNSAVKLQQHRMEEIQERRNQLEMVLKWHDELEYELEMEVNAVDGILSQRTKRNLNDLGRADARKLIQRFGFAEVCESLRIAIDKYYNGTSSSLNYALAKVGGICYNRKYRPKDGGR